MQSVELIRSHGLKSRMCEPQVSITKIPVARVRLAEIRTLQSNHWEELSATILVLRDYTQRR